MKQPVGIPASQGETPGSLWLAEQHSTDLLKVEIILQVCNSRNDYFYFYLFITVHGKTNHNQ